MMSQIKNFLLIIIVSMVYQVNALSEITNLTTFTDVITFKKTPFSYYDYILDEKTGYLVYVYCSGLNSTQHQLQKYMSCQVTVKPSNFVDSNTSSTCYADFSDEPVDLLKTLNTYYAYRHKVILLNSDKVFLVKNSWTAGDPVKMELLIVRMSDCTVKRRLKKALLRPHVYPKENVFDIIHLKQDDSAVYGTFVKVTYNETGTQLLKPVKYFFSSSIFKKFNLFVEPVYIGSSDEVSYMHVFNNNSTGLAYHTIFQGGFIGQPKILIKTGNAIFGRSVNKFITSFCWLIETNIISCISYDSKGQVKLNVSKSFFDDSIPWETDLPLKRKPSLEYYKSRQLKLHSLHDGGLLLVAVNKISHINGSSLTSRIESFDIVRVDRNTSHYCLPQKIQIGDSKTHNVRLTTPRSSENVYFPRVNVFESKDNVCLAYWCDFKVSNFRTYHNLVTFSEKCFSKTDLYV